jgi:hypothetical protein
VSRQPRARWGRLLSVDDAAEYLGISPGTFRGLGIVTVRIGMRVLYDIRELDEYVDRLSPTGGTIEFD